MTKEPGSKRSAASSYKTVGKTYDGVEVLAPKMGSKTFSTAEVRRAIKKAFEEGLSSAKNKPLRETDALRVEQRDDGQFQVKRPGAKRVSAVTKTQAAAITRARELEPGAKPIVKRVRKQSGAKKGTWREV